MYSHEKNEAKVIVATRQQAVSDHAALLGSLLLLVVLSVVVLIGRPAGFM